MHIIFGTNAVDQLKQDGKHTILELDTIRPAPGKDAVTAYCVVESIPLTEISQTEAYTTWHQDLLKAYRRCDWDECVRCLNLLSGKFSGELDTFYNELRDRIRIFLRNPPPDNWDGVFEPWNNPVDND